MKNILSFGLIIIWSINILPAQITPTIPLEKGVQHYTINTADNYSLFTRSSTYTFKNVRVSEIADVIKENLSAYGSISINETLNMLVIKEEERKLQNILDLCENLDGPKMGEFLEIRTRRIPLKYNQPSMLSGFLRSYLSVDGSIQFDDVLNVIIVHDHESKLDLIETEIKKFDVPPEQVKIDVEIIEITGSGMLDAGINWDAILESDINDIYGVWRGDKDDRFQRYDTHSNIGSENEDRDINESRSKDDRNLGTINVRIGIPRLSDIIRLLEEKGQAKVISSPSIVTLNNQQGTIWIGTDVAPDSRSRNNRNKPISAGIYLNVIPHIGSSDLMTLELECQLTDEYNNNQRIESQILIREGNTYVIGGLTKTNKVKVKKRVPILGVVLPFIFSKNITVDETVEVAVLLTPHIIDIDTYSKESTEMKSKYDNDDK